MYNVFDRAGQKYETKLLTLFLHCVNINIVKEVNKVMEE